MKPIRDLDDQALEALARKAAALPDAPPALVRAAIDLWQTAQPQSLAGAVRRIVAALSFDSWAPGTALSMRSVPSDSRHLLFSAQGRDIDLRIAPSNDSFTLSGQILGPDESGRVELVPQTSESTAVVPLVAALDELGEFRMEGLSRGTYVATLHVGADEIALPPIEVGDRRT